MIDVIAPKSESAVAEHGRRFLLTAVVSRYHHDQSWNREELAQDLRRIVELFTRELGYEHVPLMGLDPTWLQIQEALRDFCMSQERRPSDYIVVYVAGHGEVLTIGDSGFEHVLLPADALPNDLRRRAIKSSDLAEWILADTPVRRLLLIVDACFSGLGGFDFSRNALARMGSPARLSQEEGSGVVVVTATQPTQLAIAGAFTSALVRAIRHQATAGRVPGALSIDAVMRVLVADGELPASQQAQWTLLAGSGSIPDFLPNPRRDESSAEIDLDLAEANRRWRTRLDHENLRAEELRNQFIPRTTGFTGRYRALASISSWLNTSTNASAMVVTGDPGSGKTAILGILASLADPRRRPTVPRDGLPPQVIPGDGAIGAAIYAGNLTASQVLAGLAVSAGVDDIDPDPGALSDGLIRLLSGLRKDHRPLTVMIDALDEAVDPPDLAGQLLRPLIEQSDGFVRLLLGTRRHVCDHFGHGWKEKCELIDLDSREYADPFALAAVVRRVLTRGNPEASASTEGTPFTSCPPPILDAITAAITEAAGHSFFVARIIAGTQASQDTVPDPTDRAWRVSLPRTAGTAMRLDLETRLQDQAIRAVDLMRPLAYAQGTGLPWEDVWPLLANALAPGHRYTNEDLLWLTDHAGSFIIEGGTIADRSVYRLYHRSLADDLFSGRDQEADEAAISRALISHVPRHSDGRPDWPSSHPYIRAHLSTHAARGGEIDNLVQDPGFLLAADASSLLAALDATVSMVGRASAGAYRSALPLMRRHSPGECNAYLGMAARCGRADPLAYRLDSDGDHSLWRARWASCQLQRPHELLAGHDGAVTSVAVVELDGRPLVISGSEDQTVRVWNPVTCSPVGEPLVGHDNWVTSVATAELDGRPVVVSGSGDRTVRVWDLATGTCIGGPFSGHDGPVTSVATAELDGRPVVVSGSGDRTVRVWDLATGTCIGGPFSGHDGPVTSVATAELDGRPVVVSGSGDRTVRVWDLATGAPVGRMFTGHSGWVWSVATAELDGRPVVVSGSGDRTVRVWDLATGTSTGSPLIGHTRWVRTVGVAALNGRPVAISGSEDQMMRIWDLVSGAPVGVPFSGHTGWVRSVTSAELDGRPVVISGGEDRTVRIWDLGADAPIDSPFTGHDGPVTTVAIAALNDDSFAVISGSADRTIRTWDLTRGDRIGEPFEGHDGAVTSVAVAELKGRSVVISGSADRTVRIWDSATGIPIGPIGTRVARHGGAVTAVACAEIDGRPVAISGSVDRTLRIWDLATNAPVGGRLAHHNGAVTSVVTARIDERQVVVSGSADRTVRIWDLVAGVPIGEPLVGHEGAVNSVTITELDDRQVVVSGSVDRTVRIWDLVAGVPIGEPLVGHEGAVNSVIIAELDDRPVIISGGADRTIKIWDLATATTLAGRPVENQALTASATSYNYNFSDSETKKKPMAEIELNSSVLALARRGYNSLVAASELGIVVFDLPVNAS